MAERFGKGYENLDDAAAAALMALSFQPRVDAQEYMALVYRDPNDGKFYRTGFQTQSNRHSSEWTGRPEGKVAAVIHNHPKPQVGDRYQSTSFSNQDANTAFEMQVPSYIAAMQHQAPSADRKLEPGAHKTNTVQQGNEFLAQIPIEEMLQQMARTSPMMRAYLAAKKPGANPLTAALGK